MGRIIKAGANQRNSLKKVSIVSEHGSVERITAKHAANIYGRMYKQEAVDIKKAIDVLEKYYIR